MSIAPIMWAENEDELWITVTLQDAKTPTVTLTEENFTYKFEKYEFTLPFTKKADPAASTYAARDRGTELRIIKADDSKGFWGKLTKSPQFKKYITTDWELYYDPDDEQDAKKPDASFGQDPMSMMNMMGGMGGMGGMPGMGGGMGGMGDLASLMGGMGGMGGMPGMGGGPGGMGGMDMAQMMQMMGGMGGGGMPGMPPMGGIPGMGGEGGDMDPAQMQQMMQMLQSMQQGGADHVHGENCNHDHDHDHGDDAAADEVE